ncbi:MAG: glycosyltransferase family 9 protein [Candidatus Omnitrophica bacterium]|nr:glycosyltransferase family 9 protein [Candidatus Omnitrophota bacterium]
MTNIGDAVLTCPVIDILREDFPDARIDVVTGPKAVSLFKDNPHIHVIEYNKHACLKEQWAWFLSLWKARYDCVVDLRRTMLGLLLWPKFATPLWGQDIKAIHKKEIHLNRLRQVYDFKETPKKRYAIQTTPEDQAFFEREILPFVKGQKFVVIAPGAADLAKRWNPDGFAALAEYLSHDYKIVFVGDSKDALIIQEIQKGLKCSTLSLAGKTNLRTLGLILQQASWAIAHDSGIMHLASYFNVPLVVLWGPTDIHRYAPWGSQSVVVRKNEGCERCRNPEIKTIHNCMSFIKVEDVIHACKKLS